jgi:predicted nucleic acid-binding protein
LIVLDASLMVEWLLRGDRQSAYPTIYTALSEVPVRVPAHWPLEIGNALQPDLRSRSLSIFDFHELMTEFDHIDIRVMPPLDLDEIGPLAQFAVSNNLTTYDAAYVQLALLQQATLATLDRAMRKAAAALNIPLLPAALP